MAYLSPTTSRLIVNGQMKSQERDLQSRYDIMMNGPKLTREASLSSIKKWYERAIKTTFGEMIISSWQEKRMMNAIVIMPISPSADCSRPYQAHITMYSYNLRSTASHNYMIALLTTHVMERLMERRKDVKLIELIKDEFDVNFIDQLMLHVYSKNSRDVANHLDNGSEFKLKTKNGYVCGIFENRKLVLKTWYP